MGTPREPDTGVSGNGGEAASWSNGKRRKTGADLATSPKVLMTLSAGAREICDLRSQISPRFSFFFP
ncbi:hypothetical protein EAI89_05210 [Eubacterium sp. am_0171]|nr:hypothetical protein EAI89_05210 [Eubacterium sp. am_0171]